MKQTDPWGFSAVTANVALDYLELVDPSVKVGVVEFSDVASQRTQGLVTVSNARRALQVDRLTPPNGGTAMTEGMQAAFQMLSSGGGEKQIVLITDGDPTTPWNEASIITQAKSQNIKVFALGIGTQISADKKKSLGNVAKQSGGESQFDNQADELVDKLRRMFASQNQQIWNVNEVLPRTELASEKTVQEFVLPQGMDRVRVTAVFKIYNRFRDGDFDIKVSGPTPVSVSQGLSYLVRPTGSGNQDTVAVWSALVLRPQAGKYEIAVKATALPQHGGLILFVDSYADIKVRLNLVPNQQNGYQVGTSVNVDVSVKDGSGNDVQPQSLNGKVTGSGNTGGSTIQFPANSLTGQTTLPNTPGDYELTVNAVLASKLIFPSAPIRFRVNGPGAIYLNSNTQKLDFAGRSLSVDDPEIKSEFIVTYDQDQTGGPRRQRPIQARATWALDPAEKKSGSPITNWVALETSDGRPIRVDGRSEFQIRDGGENLVLKVKLPDPSDPAFRTLVDGDYIGSLEIRSDQAQNVVVLDVKFHFIRPTLELKLLRSSVAFFWNPYTAREIPLLRIFSNYSKNSTFELTLPDRLMAGGVHFADVVLLKDGRDLRGRNDSGKQTYGPFDLGRDAAEFDVRITPVMPKEKFTISGPVDPVSLTVNSPFSLAPETRELKVTTLGSAPRTWPLLGNIDLPVIGPLSWYLSNLSIYAAFALFLYGLIKRCILLSRFPTQMKWRKGTSIRPTMPADVTLSRRGRHRFLDLPTQWTKSKLGPAGVLARAAISSQDRLLLSGIDNSRLLYQGEAIEAKNVEVDDNETIEIVSNAKKKRLRPTWAFRFIQADQENNYAKFRILRSPYNPNVLRWVIGLLLMCVVILVVINGLRSDVVANFINSFDSQIFGAVPSRLVGLFQK